MNGIRPGFAAIAAAIAYAALLPTIAHGQSSPDDLLRQAANGRAISLMPDERSPRVRRTRPPVSSPGRALGEQADPLGGDAQDPGSTNPTAGTPSGGKAKLSISCRRAGRRFVCRVSRSGSGRAVVTCRGKSKAKVRRSCLNKAARRLGPSARSSALSWQGFPTPRMAAVGRLLIFYPGTTAYGNCSGTVVARTLVLAAGHCLNPSNGAKPSDILFLPGAGPGTSAGALDFNMPYGKWVASNWFAPGGWQSNADGALDWALIEIPPTSSGQTISSVTGAFQVLPNITFKAGAQIYAVGYPSSGYWSTLQGGLGRGQYACSGTWGGEWQRIDSGWELFQSCTMNRGASGGPWFVKLGDGRWVVGGINNRCKSRFDHPPENPTSYCDPYSDWMRSSYIDGRFTTFWNSVQSQLRFR